MAHRSVTSGGALVSGLVLKAVPGSHISTHVTIDPSAPSQLYWVQMVLSATLPADGAVTFFHSPRPVQHVQGRQDEVTWDDGENGSGFAPGPGLCVVLSTTQFTLARAGAYMMVDGTVDA